MDLPIDLNKCCTAVLIIYSVFNYTMLNYRNVLRHGVARTHFCPQHVCPQPEGINNYSYEMYW